MLLYSPTALVGTEKAYNPADDQDQPKGEARPIKRQSI